MDYVKLHYTMNNFVTCGTELT